MKAAMGQSPENCFCHVADGTLSCNSRGCSIGTNKFCKNGFVILHRDHAGNRNGCNCPSRHSKGHGDTFGDRLHTGRPGHGNHHHHGGTHNGYVGRTGYNYNTCTAYGVNARDSSGKVPAAANAATSCCNFCCGRNDPHPFPTPTIAPISGGREIKINKFLYLNGLVMLVIIALKRN